MRTCVCTTKQFLSKKKSKKKQKTKKKNQQKSTKKPSANAVQTKTNESPAKQHQIKKKADVYYLTPSKVEALKDAQGNIFLAINPRKVSSDLSKYTYLRCIISLKNRLKKKKANEAEYSAVLIDFRSLSDYQREVERNKLVKGFENVVSFVLTSVHRIEYNEKALDLDQALIQYQEDGVFINTKPLSTPKNESAESEQKGTPKSVTPNDKSLKSTTPKAEQKESAAQSEEKESAKLEQKESANEITVPSAKGGLSKAAESEKEIASKPNAKSTTPKSEVSKSPQPKKVNPVESLSDNSSKSTTPKSEQIEPAKVISAETEQKNRAKLGNKKQPRSDKQASVRKVPSAKSKSKSTTPKPQKNAHAKAKSMPLEQEDEDKEIIYFSDYNSEADEFEYITASLMNKVRLNQSDFIGDDTALNDCDINGFYVRIKSGSKAYKMHKIKAIMHYPTEYRFKKSIKTSKGLQVYKGKKIINQRLTKVSNDAFTEKEVKLWKEAARNHQMLPNEQTLRNGIERLESIRNFIATRQRQQAFEHGNFVQIDEQCQQHQPGSVPPGFTMPSSQGLNAGLLAQLNEQNSFEKELKRRYDDAISAGYLCFWAIPKCENGDSKYIAFLLAKSKKNKEFLQEAEDRAKEIFASHGVDVNAIKFVEIREWREVGSKSPYKCKGFLLNCKNNEIALEIRQCLMQSIFPKVIGFNQNTKICRLGDQWFGDDFMSFVLFFFFAFYMIECLWLTEIQLLPNRNKPDDARKPHGPKTDYSQIGEPSIIAMSECPERVTYGEFDHSEVATSAVFDVNDQSDVQSVFSDVSHTTNQTVARYDDIMHMTMNQQRQSNIRKTTAKNTTT